MITSTVPASQIPLQRRAYRPRRLGRIVSLQGLGDDGSGWDGEGYGSQVNYGDPSGGYSNLSTDTSPSVPDYSTIDETNVGYDPTLQANAIDTGFTLTAEGTAALPTISQAQGTLISWGDELGSFMNGLLGTTTHPTTPIVGTTGASTTHATTSIPTTVKSAPANLPKPTISKPPKVQGYPDVAAYEKLFAANLAGFMASAKSDSDKVSGENFFTQEWAIFSNDMGQAGSWGTSGLAQRNRGGSLDWWKQYYDPIANSATSGAGVGSSLLSGSNSGLLLLVLAGVVVWWMTE